MDDDRDQLEMAIEAILAAKAKPTAEARQLIHQILKRKYAKLETQKTPRNREAGGASE